LSRRKQGKQMSESQFPKQLTPDHLAGSIRQETEKTPIQDATWYTAQAVGDGVVYRFPAGALAGARYLTADMLLDGQHKTSFLLTLQEGEDGPKFGLKFSLLNQCSARMRMPLEAVNQGRVSYPREGAWLKPRCLYQRVDLDRVDRMAITVLLKSSLPSRWCMTDVVATLDEPPLMEELVLPKGLLLDEVGQNAIHEWPAKSRSPDEVTARLRAQLDAAPSQRWPDGFSRWGGWQERRVEATGFFRTHRDDQRWWLVDPDGYLFWSSGLDCIRSRIEAVYAGLEPALAWIPDSTGQYQEAIEPGRAINYLGANFIRAFGPDEWYPKWAEIALAELKRVGFNTVANWSEWQIARDASVPYVRPMSGDRLQFPSVYRGFPDVFLPEYRDAAAAFAEQLRETADDPALIGYFLMNEPAWGFAEETPAAGMLFNTPSCATRAALGKFLRQRYGTDHALASAWGIEATFDAIAEGEWHTRLTPPAEADLADFSEIMVDRYFRGLSEACRAVDPNHLNLGIRHHTIPPAWAVKGMQSFDVFSMNCYKRRVLAEQMAHIAETLDRPIMIGEWHFGALDVGLPASGIGHVPDQESRGKAFRIYLEDAAAKPWCVGAHYFTLYDQSAIGRFDGENYQIGFMDVCNRPYEPLADAARASHERLYQVASGQIAPYDDEPQYLPLLF
jgi:hypothetical protein